MTGTITLSRAFIFNECGAFEVGHLVSLSIALRSFEGRIKHILGG
jgi:hypothetical protein